MLIKIALIIILVASAITFAILRYMYTQDEYSDEPVRAFIVFSSLFLAGLDFSILLFLQHL